RSRSFIRLSNCIHPPDKPDATVIRRNMDAESGWEPRRGAFRVPRALSEGGGESMSVEENLRVIEAAQKALNDRDLDRFETLHLNSVLQREPQNPQGIKGPKAIRASLQPFLTAFPDIRFATETQFGVGDWVTQLGHVRGTNTGPLEMPGGPTIPATNKAVRLPVAMVAKLEGGKFAEITFISTKRASWPSSACCPRHRNRSRDNLQYPGRAEDAQPGFFLGRKALRVACPGLARSA